MAHIMINGDGYMDLSITIFFLAVFVLFVYQTTRKKRYAPFFILSFFFGMIGGLFSFFYAIFPSIGVNFFRLFSSTFLALQFVFFFLFMESTRSIKINALRWSITLIIFTIQMVASFGIILFSKYPDFSAIYPALIFLTLFSFYFLGSYVYLIIGAPIYIKTYKYTKEIRPLLLALALIIISVGFIACAYYHVLVFLGINAMVGRLNVLLLLSYAFPLIGLFIFLLCYITDVDYLYRLPNDIYVLNVSYKSGATIHTVWFKTRNKKMEIEENLLNESIPSIIKVFKRIISSQVKPTIIMESGKYICATIVTDNISAILDRSLKRYITEFEKKFQKQLEKEDQLISDFDSAKDLIHPIFPFLVIEK